MRILYVINSLDGGGGALPLPHVIGVMRDAGHDVHVVSLMERDGRARPVLEDAGIEYEVIGGPKRRFVETAWRLDRIVRRVRPDFLWTSLTHATVTGQLIGRVRHIPVVSWLHNAWLKPANERLLRRTSALTARWVADSQTVALFGEERLGIEASSIDVWPLFIADGTAPIAAPWSSGPFRIGSLGRLHPNKGYDVLIRAVAHLYQQAPQLIGCFSIHVAGEGPERDALERLAVELGVESVRFEGFTAQPQEFLAGLHGYVQPSHHEGLCIAAHQAMVAALPLIASPVGEMRHSVLASGGGALAPYGDVATLAEQLGSLIADPGQAAAAGARGRKWVLRDFSEKEFAVRGRAALTGAGIV